MDSDSGRVAERSGAGLLLSGESASGSSGCRPRRSAAAPRELSCGRTGERPTIRCVQTVIRCFEPVCGAKADLSATDKSGNLDASGKAFEAAARDPVAPVGKEIGDRAGRAHHTIVATAILDVDQVVS
jgi:hypothetical protein